MVSSAYLRLMIFLLAIMIRACDSSSLAFCTMDSVCKLNNQGNNIQALMYSLPNLEPVCCSVSSTNCCFSTYIDVSQEAGKVVWYSHLLKNFLQFAVIHTVNGFSIVNEAEVDIFLELSCFLCDPKNVRNLISDSSAFSKSILYI